MAKEIHKNLSEKNQPPGWELNPESPTYETEFLTHPRS
jgi:hypothetical protein